MPPKSPKEGWKTGEQLEFLLSRYASFQNAQDAKTLDRFWVKLFEDWYHRWKLPSSPTPELLQQYGTLEEARYMIQTEKNAKIKNWFNGRGRAEGGRGKLRLDAGEKRMLAPVQAYCSYAWDATLRDIVLKRWEEEKARDTFFDDEDPPVGASRGAGSVPLAFKLRIAKEEYERLSDEQRNEINRRREEDKKKHGTKVPEIADEGERIEKLLLHKSNQPMIEKSLLRAITNLQDQAGCVVQVLVGFVDPEEGKLLVRKFCRGETPHGLNFETFYGDDWDNGVEKKFRDWSRRVFGDKGTDRRKLFLLNDPDVRPGASESGPTETPGASSSTSQIPPKASKSRKTLKAASSKVVPIRATPSQTSASQPSESLESAQPPGSDSDGPTTQPSFMQLPTLQPAATSGLPQNSSTPTLVTPASHISIDRSPVAGPPSEEDMLLAATAIGVHQILSQVAAGTVQPPPMAASENPDTQPSQLFVSPSELVVEPQVVIQPATGTRSHTPAESSPTIPAGSTTTTSTSPQQPVDDSATSNRPMAKVPYRTNVLAATPTQKPRRNSMEGAPEMIVEMIDGEVTVDIRDYLSIDDDSESHVSSSQRTADGSRELPPPPPASQQAQATNPSTRELPQLNVDEEDLPTWMVKKNQWKYVASTRGGAAWEALLNIYMKQERRLEFTEMGATLTTKDRPTIIKEYFQYAHQPSRGEVLAVPKFGTEVAKWWGEIQPEWRRSVHDLPQSVDQWSYILSGGSKGAFILILCLAWWDRAHGRHLEQRRTIRTEAEAAGAATSFDDLPDHDAEWLKIVNDVAFVMRKAQDSQIPGRGMSGSSSGVKRKREVEPPVARKRSTPSRTRSRA